VRGRVAMMEAVTIFFLNFVAAHAFNVNLLCLSQFSAVGTLGDGSSFLLNLEQRSFGMVALR
jgi:hypothetical protein